MTGALLGYVLPVASAGGVTTIPSRLAGWWLASVVGTAAVLLLSPKSPGDRLRASAAATAAAVGRQLRAAVRGAMTPADLEATLAAKHVLMETFTATPYRPTGLATADQAMANVVQILEWCAALTADATDGHADPARADVADRELLSVAADVLTDTASLLSGADVRPGFDRLEAARAASAAHQQDVSGDPDAARVAAAQAFHAQTIALAARTAAADALIATRRADPETIAAERAAGTANRKPGRRNRSHGWSRWWAASASYPGTPASVRCGSSTPSGARWRWPSPSPSPTSAGSARILGGAGHPVGAADQRSGDRGHGVAGTGRDRGRIRDRRGPAGGHRDRPGRPVGGAAGRRSRRVVRAGDRSVPGGPGCVHDHDRGAVQPAGPGGLAGRAAAHPGRRDRLCGQPGHRSAVLAARRRPLVGDDLADAFRRGAAYLTQAVDCALGLRPDPPDTAIAAVTAGIRLDDALRGYLTEQGRSD